MDIAVDKIIDAKGLACPMPIVKTKKGIGEIQPGQVLEVQATDRGSIADIQGWARNTGHQYLGTVEEQGGIYRHYLRKGNPHEVKEAAKFPNTTSNEELQSRLHEGNLMVLDVREPAEYAFGHIPGAISIPLGNLEDRIHELDASQEILVVCRTGSRSDLACQLLNEKGFKNVVNVLPGMSAWQGPLEKQ